MDSWGPPPPQRPPAWISGGGAPGPTHGQIARTRFAGDPAVASAVVDERRRDPLLACLVQAWQPLGLPAQVHCDPGKACCGLGRWPGALARVRRRCRWRPVAPVFRPAGRPQRHGRVAHGNGGFPPRRLARRCQGAAPGRRARRRVQETGHARHVPPQLGSQRAAT
jgi:hypothetical protein